MAPAVANLPVVQFPHANLNGTQINGNGTYNYTQTTHPTSG
jgi:hypothetical protein